MPLPIAQSSGGQIGRKLIELDSIADLPTDWFGYEAVDVLIISAGDGKLCRELAADQAQICGARAMGRARRPVGDAVRRKNAASDARPNGPLARSRRASWPRSFGLPETGPLEHSPASTAPIDRRTRRFEVPRLVDVEGNIEVYAGRRPSDLPLVVRAARGFGEVTFVGVEFSQPPLADVVGPDGVSSRAVAPLSGRCGAERCHATTRHERVQRSIGRAAAAAWPIVSRRRADWFSGRRRAGDRVLAVSRAARLSARFIAGCAGRWWRGFRFRSSSRRFRSLALAVGNWSRGSGEHARESTGARRFRHAHRPGARHVLGDAFTAPRPNQFDLAVKLPTTVLRSDQRQPKCCFPGGGCRASASAECKRAALIWGSFAAAIATARTEIRSSRCRCWRRRRNR